MFSEKHEPMSTIASEGLIFAFDGFTGMTVRKRGGGCDGEAGPCILGVVEYALEDLKLPGIG